MNTILLATDFSDEAANAAAIAEAIARRSGDRLAMLHVTEPPSTVPLELTTDARLFEAELRERARSDLRAEVERARSRGLAVSERLQAGDPPEVIAAVARELEARLIVLGSHGRRALARLVLGSVARGTLSLSDRPVLVTRTGARHAALAAWAAGDRPLRVLMGLDRSPASAAALAWVRWLRGIGPIDLRLAHAYDPFLTTIRLGMHPAKEVPGELIPALEAELRGFVEGSGGAGPASYALLATDGRPAEALVAEAERAEADLVVVGTNQRHGLQRIWLGSSAELLLRTAPIPVVCVPAVSRARLEDAQKPDEVC